MGSNIAFWLEFRIIGTYMEKRLECQVFGRVQLVMFRDFVTRKARARGIVGTVKNNPDGSVSVVAQGDEAWQLRRRGGLLHF